MIQPSRETMKQTLLSVCLLALASAVTAQTIFESNFAQFPQGPLAGQQGWQQFGTIATNPISVANGHVTWQGGATTDLQDVVRPFTDLVPTPATGSTTVHVDMMVRISSSGTNPSYFAALNTLNTLSSANSNFANARISAFDEGSNTYKFAVRLTGQSSLPWVKSTATYNYGQAYAVRMVATLVGGLQNDAVDLHVGSDFNSLTLQASSVNATGLGTDPVSYGGFLLSQFANATTQQSGVAISMVKVYIPQATSVDDAGRQTPDAIALHGAYPNPFNPSTAIRFTLDAGRQTRLAVYDMLGRQVAVLVDGQMPAGEHRASFDATGLTSGVYIVRLEAGGMSMTRRITLLK